MNGCPPTNQLSMTSSILGDTSYEDTILLKLGAGQVTGSGMEEIIVIITH